MKSKPASEREVTIKADGAETRLASYRLGEKLRRLRLKRKISLVDLGKLTALPPPCSHNWKSCLI